MTKILSVLNICSLISRLTELFCNQHAIHVSIRTRIKSKHDSNFINKHPWLGNREMKIMLFIIFQSIFLYQAIFHFLYIPLPKPTTPLQFTTSNTSESSPKTNPNISFPTNSAKSKIPRYKKPPIDITSSNRQSPFGSDFSIT